MTDPIFWLGLSLGCVALGLLLLCVAMLPAARDFQRAARSVERLANTLTRELPPTLESFRQTGTELGDLTENVTSSVRHASETLGHVNDSVSSVRRRTKQVRGTAQGAIAGMRAAWQVWVRGDVDREGLEERVVRNRKLERELRYDAELNGESRRSFDHDD